MNKTRSVLSVVAVLALLAGCQNTPQKQPKWPGEVNHVVICWLKNPNDGEAMLRLIAASNSFRQIPGVIAVHAGPRLELPGSSTPARGGPKGTNPVDDTFDLGVVITFVNKDALQSYQIDPIHQQAVRDVLVPYVREYRTYDFLTR